MLLLHTTRLYAHEPGRRRRLTSLAVMTTTAAGRHDTPGSPTEHSDNAKHGSGRMRSTDWLQVIVELALRLVGGTLVFSKLRPFISAFAISTLLVFFRPLVAFVKSECCGASGHRRPTEPAV
jgi:hypothetical protein